MRVSQIDFRAALTDPGLPVPPGLTGPADAPAGRRFAVYRNNVAHSLAQALELAFPLVRRIVGEEFFRAMATEFARAHPPASPVLMFYGAAMPGFLGRFPPVAGLGYLPDAARLDLALRESYHAADCEPLGAGALQQGGDLMAARLTLAPALRMVRSRWPLHGIWRANFEPGAPQPRNAPEDILITRPGFDPVIAPLPPGGAYFIAALGRGEPLGAAILSPGTGFDLGPTLGALLRGGAIAGINYGD